MYSYFSFRKIQCFESTVKFQFSMMALQKLQPTLKEELKGLYRLYGSSCNKASLRTLSCNRCCISLNCSMLNRRLASGHNLATSLILKHSMSIAKTSVWCVNRNIERHYSPKAATEDEFVEKLFKGITDCDRGSLARGITLIESTHPKKKEQAQQLLSKVLLLEKGSHAHSIHDSQAFRIGEEPFS